MFFNNTDQVEANQQMRSVISGQFQTTAQLRTLLCTSFILRAVCRTIFTLNSQIILSGCWFLYVFDKRS